MNIHGRKCGSLSLEGHIKRRIHSNREKITLEEEIELPNTQILVHFVLNSFHTLTEGSGKQVMLSS